jgi:HSP20 family protein
MNIIRWEPLREVEEAFDRYAKAMHIDREHGHVQSGDWTPRVDISETAKLFNIKAEIPDVHKDDVKVSVEDGILSIRGERKHEKEEDGKTFHRVERYYGSFVRSFTLPSNVDSNKIKATFKDGMLDLQIPKTVEVKPKAVEVHVEAA